MQRDVKRLLSDAESLSKSYLANKNNETSAEINVRSKKSIKSHNSNEMEFEKLGREVKIQNLEKRIVYENTQSSQGRSQFITELAEYMMDNHAWCPH